MYIHNQIDWPRFKFDREKLAERLAIAHLKQGRLLERMDGLGFSLQQEANLKALTQ